MNQKRIKQLREKVSGKTTVGGISVPRKVSGERTDITRLKGDKPVKKEMVVYGTGRYPSKRANSTNQPKEVERPKFIGEPSMPGFNSFGY